MSISSPLVEGWVLNTGKSDCTVLCCGTETVVIDTADADDFTAISAKLDELGGGIDYLILTHYDKDHIGSAAALIERYGAGCIYAPDYTSDSEEYRALRCAAQKRGVEITVLNDDTVFYAGECSFAIDAPDADEYADDNNYSLITALYCKNINLLFLGDAKKERVGEWNATHCCTRFAMIKLPHHGDFNKATGELLTLTRPENTVICAADDSTVEDSLTEVLDSAGTACYFTYNGEISFLCDGDNFEINQ